MTRSATSVLDADVVVLGSGAAGLFAAVEAADAGATTVVVESEPQLGGSTRLSGGYVALCETALEPGSREDLFEDLQASHLHDANDELSHVYVARAGETYDRLVSLGVQFARTKQFAYMRRPWAHELPTGGSGGGAQIVAALGDAARTRGVQVLTETRAVALRQRDGRIVGVDADRDGARLRLRVHRGVVVATGGFTRSPELVRAFGPRGTDRIVPITGPGSRGDGLRMSLQAGAAVADLSVGIAPTAPIEPESGVGHLPLYSGGVAMNLHGRRFCDESSSYLDICWAGLDQPEAAIVQVYDTRIEADYRTSMLGQVMHGGRTFEAPTLSALFDDVSARTDWTPRGHWRPCVATTRASTRGATSSSVDSTCWGTPDNAYAWTRLRSLRPSRSRGRPTSTEVWRWTRTCG